MAAGRPDPGRDPPQNSLAAGQKIVKIYGLQNGTPPTKTAL